MTRAEKVTEAQRLRGEGLKTREVAARMGVPRTTVQAWLTDPDLSKQRARRERYRGRCLDCGKPTDGSNGAASAPERCALCTARHNAKWTRETVVAAIRRFAERYGRPPGATDFNAALARSHGHHWRSERFYADGDYPGASSVIKVFGTWNAAIVAAGFEPSRRGGWYPRSKHGDGYATGAHLDHERAAA